MVDLLFLGTGGGRFNLVRQLRGTGGFMLLGQTLRIHVDPGPGALLRALDAGQDPARTDAILVTHMHVDHVSDAGVLVEAMSGCTFKRRGLILASRSVLDGDRDGDRSISRYHQSLVPDCVRFGPSDALAPTLTNSRGQSASFSIRGVPTKHDDPGGFGFVLELEGVKIGYTSDTEYLPAVHNAAFAGADVLIANNLKSADDGIPDHLNSRDLVSLLRAAKPGLCILSHMGLGLIRAGPEAEAARIESASGVRTIAGKDGWYYCTDRGGWFDISKARAHAPSARSPRGQKTLGE